MTVTVNQSIDGSLTDCLLFEQLVARLFAFHLRVEAVGVAAAAAVNKLFTTARLGIEVPTEEFRLARTGINFHLANCRRELRPAGVKRSILL